MLKPGLYEQVINQEIKTELAETAEDQKLSQKIDAAEASDILTGYISEVIKKRLDMISDGENVAAQVELVNKIVNVLSGETGDDISELAVTEDAEQLIALLSAEDPMVKLGKKKAKDIVRPETSISQSTDIILENIKKSFSDKNGLISKIKTFVEDTELPLTMGNFVSYYHIPLKTIYKKYSFSRLCVEAEVQPDFAEPLEDVITKNLGKVVAIDSRRWIGFLINNLRDISIEKIRSMSQIEQRMMQMFYISIWNEAADWNDSKTAENIENLAKSPTMVNEIIELLAYNLEHIDFIDKEVQLGFECPLDVHCTYTRNQLLVALDYMTPNSVQGGVIWLPEKKSDVFMVTLNKASKDYSPTTMYKDYSINESLFHWQSQNKTSETSASGKRYINHQAMGTRVLLFVREFMNDELGTAPYTFLGTASYMKHTGNKPMSITWHLDDVIPAKYLKKTNKLVVG